MIELLESSTSEGPIPRAPPGLLPVLTCEVDDPAGCVALACQRGFNPPDPGSGMVPGTRVSAMPAEEISGIQFQLLEYG